MAVKIFSLKTEGNKQLSANFKVAEFKCSDGSDKVLIDDALILLLQKIRDHFCAAITINSAYRTEAHNKKIGGATNSQHTKGTAADIVVKGVTPLAVAQYAESLGAGGIGHYPAGQGNFTHVDTRATQYRWEQRNGKEVAVAGFSGQAKEIEEDMTTVESKKMMVNGAPVQIRSILEQNENYVHLRDIAAATGMKIGYDAAKNLVIVESGR